MLFNKKGIEFYKILCLKKYIFYCYIFLKAMLKKKAKPPHIANKLSTINIAESNPIIYLLFLKLYYFAGGIFISLSLNLASNIPTINAITGIDHPKAIKAQVG